MERESKAPPAHTTSTRTGEALERMITAPKRPLRLPSQAGSTSCRPRSPDTREQTLILSPDLTLRASISRTRPHSVQHEHLELLTGGGRRSLLSQSLKRRSEGKLRLRIGTIKRASERDRASRSSPSTISCLQYTRRPRFIRLQFVGGLRSSQRQLSTETVQCSRYLHSSGGLRCHDSLRLEIVHRL